MTVPIGAPVDARSAGSGDGTEHDAQVVQQRRQAVCQETLPGDKHLAHRDRDREDQHRHAHDCGTARVLGDLLAASKPGATSWAVHGAMTNSTATAAAMTRRRGGHDRSRECCPPLPGRRAPCARRTGTKAADSPRDDQHVQHQLRQHERRVVDIQLAARAEGAGERPVAEQAHAVAPERQHRQQQRTRRQCSGRAAGRRSGATTSGPGAGHGVGWTRSFPRNDAWV